MRILYLLFILTLVGCSTNFYPENYKGKKRGFKYYEIIKTGETTYICKKRHSLFKKEDKIIKTIHTDSIGNISIIPQKDGYEKIYYKDGYDSKGFLIKNGRAVWADPALSF